MEPAYFIASRHASSHIYYHSFQQVLGDRLRFHFTTEREILQREVGYLFITKRFSSRKFLEAARRRGHRMIYICSDVFCAKPTRLLRRFHECADLFNFIIYPNQNTLHDFPKPGTPSTVLMEISQDWYRIPRRTVDFSHPRMAFFGSRQNHPKHCPYLSRTITRNVHTYTRHDDLFYRTPFYNIHIAARKDDAEIRYKPSPKVMNSIFADAIVMINRGNLPELFPEDYPFYVEDITSLHNLEERLHDSDAVNRSLDVLETNRQAFGFEAFATKLNAAFSRVAQKGL